MKRREFLKFVPAIGLIPAASLAGQHAVTHDIEPDGRRTYRRTRYVPMDAELSPGYYVYRDHAGFEGGRWHYRTIRFFIDAPVSRVLIDLGGHHILDSPTILQTDIKHICCAPTPHNGEIIIIPLEVSDPKFSLGEALRRGNYHATHGRS